MPPRSRRRLALLVALILLTFSPLFSAEFTRWDDRHTIQRNERLNPPSWTNVASYWREWRTGEFGLYVPVTHTAWSALAWAGRLDQPDASGNTLNPWVFHAANVLVHAGSTLIVFQILLIVTAGRAAAAILGAAVFALHPVQVEPVAWASGLKDVLSGMLLMAAVWQYLCSAEARLRRGSADGNVETDGRENWRYAIALLAAALAMLAKPSAVMLGPICFVLDVLILRRPWRAALLGVMPMLVMAIPVIAIARAVQVVEGHAWVPLWQRPFIAAYSVTFYLGKLLFPLSLTLDYGRNPAVILARPLTYAAPLVPLAIAIALWRCRARCGILIAAAAVFLLGMLPVLGFARFQFQEFSTVADHYLYVSMLGPAMVAAAAVSAWPTRAMKVVATALVLALAARSIVQARVWRDDFTLLPHAVAVNPASLPGNYNLGTAYEARGAVHEAAAAAARRRGEVEAAALHARESDAALRRAAELYERSIRLDGSYAPALEGFARVARHLGRRDDAVAAARRAVALRLAMPAGRRGEIGITLLALMHDLIDLGRDEEARQQADLLIELFPARADRVNEEFKDALEARSRQATTKPPAPAPATSQSATAPTTRP